MEVRYEHPDGTVWVRSGSCCLCGQCCRGDPFNGAQGDNVIDNIVSCPILRKLDDGTFSCSDRAHPYYLSGCNVWPQFPAQIAGCPDCSYTFRQAEPAT